MEIKNSIDERDQRERKIAEMRGKMS